MMEARAATVGIRATRTAKPRMDRLFHFRDRARARRRNRGIRARGFRAGSPPGPADRMYFILPKVY
jgi:hypothetical protein